MKLLTKFTFSLVLLLSCITALEAQWETIHSEGFGTGTSSFPLQNISPALSFNGFSGAANGATGGSTDRCANSSLSASNIYIAFAFGNTLSALSPDYEYRFSWNLKTLDDNIFVQYLISETAGASGTAIGSALAVPKVSALTQAGTVITSEPFTIANANSVYYLIAAAGAGNQATGTTRVRFDNFTLQRRARTLLHFDQTALTVDEGGSVEVCVTATNPDPDGQATVDVVLTSGASPHFDNYTTQTLSFASGAATVQQCFTLQTGTPTSGADDNYTYTFALQNPSGSFNPGLSEPTTLTVTVTEANPGCPWAGEDKTICEGESIQIGCPEVVPNDPNTVYCYHWLPETGLDDPGNPMPVASPGETTTYTIIITDNHGNLISDEVTVSVLEKPQIEIFPTDPILLCGNTSATLTATEELNSYEWKKLGFPQILSTSNTLIVDEPGVYKLTVSNNQCSTDIEKEIFSPGDEMAVKNYFLEKGFFPLNVKITNIDLPGVVNIENREKTITTTICESNLCLGANSICIQADANATIEIQESGQIYDLKQFIQSNLEYFASEFGYDQSTTLITANQNICACSNYISLSQQLFESAELGFWIHLWDDPNSDNDCLLILGKTPLSSEYAPSLAEQNQISSILNDVTASNNAYGFNSVSERVLFSLQDLMLDNYIGFKGDILSGAHAASQNNTPSPDHLCDSITNNEIITGIAASGIPININPPSVLRFGSKPDFPIDSRCLTGFTDLLQGVGNKFFAGRIRIKPLPYFYTGYYPIGIRGELLQAGNAYLSNPVIATNEEVLVKLGDRSVASDGVVSYSITDYKYKCTIPTNSTGEGPLSGNFEDTGDFIGGSISSSAYSATLPPITDLQIDESKEDGRFNVYGNGEILLKIRRDNVNYDWVMGIYNPDSPDGFDYFIWNCRVGLWQQFIPSPVAVERIEIPLVFNFFNFFYLYAIIDGTPGISTIGSLSDWINSATWHNALDIVGFIPIVGSVADLVNGVWYLAEGDLGNGLVTFLGIIPGLGDLAVASGYAFKFADEIYEVVKYIGKVICPSGSSCLSSIYFLLVELRRYFDPDILKLKAAEIGLGEEATERLLKWLLANTEAELGKKLTTRPDLLKAWKKADELDFSADQQTRLFKWLANTDNLSAVQKFIDNPDLIESWKILADLYPGEGANRVKDIALIEKVDQLKADAVFMQRISSPGSDFDEQVKALKNIIEKNEKAGCNACGSLNTENAHLELIDIYLNRVKSFIENYDPNLIQGTSTLISLMKNGQKYQIDAIAQTLRYIDENEQFLASNPITAFELNLTNIYTEGSDVLNNTGDIVIGLSGGGELLTELKSWKKNTLNNISSHVGFKNQVLAYFQNTSVESIENLKYIFDKNKLLKDNFENLQSFDPTNYFNDIAEAEAFIKQRFQLLIQNDNTLFFDTIWNNPSLRASLWGNSTTYIQAQMAFNTWTTNLDPILFNFIKVE